MTAVWDAALRAPAWDRDPVWFHGDLHLGNVVLLDGREHSYWEVDEPRLRKDLEKPR